jgi:hypothetical protein
VHGHVPIEQADWIERTIHVVDTMTLDLDQVAILDPIFGHRLVSPRSIGSRLAEPIYVLLEWWRRIPLAADRR